MTRGLALAVVLAIAGCSDQGRQRARAQRSQPGGHPARIEPRKARHASHEHNHGGHPHAGDAHHHHPHPHPHLDGIGGHHHPY